jgi:hypothetical protein
VTQRVSLAVLIASLIAFAPPLSCAERATFIAGISVIEALWLPTQQIMAFLTFSCRFRPSTLEHGASSSACI